MAGARARRARQEAPRRARTARIIATEKSNIVEKPLSSPLPHEHAPSTQRSGFSIYRAVFAHWDAAFQRFGLQRFVAQHKPRHSEKRRGAHRVWNCVPPLARLLLSGSRLHGPRSRRRLGVPVVGGGEERGSGLAVLRRPRRRSCWWLSPPHDRQEEIEVRETGRCAQLRG